MHRRHASPPIFASTLFAFALFASPLFASIGCGSAGGGDDGSGIADPDAATDVSTDAPPTDGKSDVAAETKADTKTDACTPSCSGKTCGSDGCGGTCGTCASGQGCDATGKCLPVCPCWAGDCSSCYCGDGVKAYETAHGCVVPELAGHEGDLMSCTGGKWSVGTSCGTSGCNVAPDGTPDTCKGSTTATHKLWVAYDSGTASCKGNTDAFFQCILSRSDFPTMESAWSTGRSLSWGASATIGSACAFHHGTDATVGQDTSTFDCVLSQTGWDVGADDVVLYFPNYSGCSDGRNHWHIPVTTKSGASVKVEIGLGFTSNVCTCQTALGMHEVYEASSDASAADCCNGQTWSPLHADCGKYAAPSYGWYDLTCGGTSYKAQLLSPSTNEWDASGCTKLTTH